MQIVIDGSKVSDLRSLIAEMVRSMTGDTQAYFGWDLNSFDDCLRGGFVGEPPYDVVVERAEPMVNALGYGCMMEYYDDMLRFLNSGRAGNRVESRGWFEKARMDALNGVGETMLDKILAVFKAVPGSLTLRGSNGEIIVKAMGKYKA